MEGDPRPPATPAPHLHGGDEQRRHGAHPRHGLQDLQSRLFGAGHGRADGDPEDDGDDDEQGAGDPARQRELLARLPRPRALDGEVEAVRKRPSETLVEDPKTGKYRLKDKG